MYTVYIILNVKVSRSTSKVPGIKYCQKRLEALLCKRISTKENGTQQ